MMWLPLRLSKRQPTPTTVLLRTTLQTRTITQTTTKYDVRSVESEECGKYDVRSAECGK